MATEHIRGHNWTFEEDVVLCFAWVSISEDGVVGTNQNKKVLWGKIVDKFNENSNTNQRECGGVYDRWKVINKACTLWKGSLERAVVDMAGGRSAAEVDCPRWGTDADKQWGRLFNSEAAQTNDINEGVDELTPTSSFSRPQRSDKQKEAKRKGKFQDPISAQIVTEFARLTESHSSLEEEAARMHLAITHEGDREQEMFECS
nr:uncharacterized protein LOC114825573 [Malus domestica]